MLVIDATGASNLPQDLRHLLFVLAYLADSKTGRGLSGQDTVGRFMGCSVREVRRKLDRLAATESPVAVIRRARYRKDGARTSDEYQLRLNYRTPAAASESDTTGRERPAVTAPEPDGPADVGDRTTGRGRSSLPDAHGRGSSQGILSDDPRRSLSSPGSSTAGSATARKRTAKPKASKPERTDEQKRAHQQLTTHYFQEFERLRSSKPIGWGKKEGQAVYDLLDKCEGDAARACLLITNGLSSWNKATIMWIASNPSACVAGGGSGGGPGVRAGDLLPGQIARAAQLEADERNAARLLRETGVPF